MALWVLLGRAYRAATIVITFRHVYVNRLYPQVYHVRTIEYQPLWCGAALFMPRRGGRSPSRNLIRSNTTHGRYRAVCINHANDAIRSGARHHIYLRTQHQSRTLLLP